MDGPTGGNGDQAKVTGARGPAAGATFEDVDPGRRLTPRQEAALAAYAHHGAYIAAAYALGISSRTLTIHLTSAYRKLGATNAIEAFRAMGWLRTDRLQIGPIILPEETVREVLGKVVGDAIAALLAEGDPE